jgi:Mn-dependent DtxR family transcriptional regulator
MYESGENYLETILVLSKRNSEVRSIDIARELEFSKPSVSRAVGILKEQGLIIIDNDGFITLTAAGRQKAESVYDRHLQLTLFLIETAGVSPERAEEDACRIEHIISEETYQGIKKFLLSRSADKVSQTGTGSSSEKI